MKTKYSYAELATSPKNPTIDSLLRRYDYVKKALLAHKIDIVEKDKQFTLPANLLPALATKQNTAPLSGDASFVILDRNEDKVLTLDLSLFHSDKEMAQIEFKWIGCNSNAFKTKVFKSESLYVFDVMNMIADFFLTERRIDSKISFVEHFDRMV
ncbi:MAG TPA: hypothetical protein PK950_00265 [Candidatus Paceibacterota bacterium]|nr:hypothetical protein [Candidatus Paceibacterota bacterium]